MNILRTIGLSKHYGSIKAIDNFDFSVSSGQIMGLLGPNGSGKTTTLGLILSILRPTSGSYEWFEGKYGKDEHRKHIGAILETPNFYPYLNADDNLDIVRQIKGVEDRDFDRVLKLVRLSGRRKSNFSTYSLGMKQRLAIAATLIGDPQVVIFDEPTNGLDPEGIAEVRNTLQKIAEQGKTVIMASHILAEVEKICSHVTIIKQGKLLASGPVGSILSSDMTLEISSNNNERMVAILEANPLIKTIQIKGSIIECTASNEISISQINKQATAENIEVTHLVSRKRKLEEEFLEITNR